MNVERLVTMAVLAPGHPAGRLRGELETEVPWTDPQDLLDAVERLRVEGS